MKPNAPEKFPTRAPHATAQHSAGEPPAGILLRLLQSKSTGATQPRKLRQQLNLASRKSKIPEEIRQPSAQTVTRRYHKGLNYRRWSAKKKPPKTRHGEVVMTTTTNPKAPKGFFAGISGIKSGVANIIDAGKTFKALGPSQIKDEIQIAKHELKTKGIAVGKGAAFFGVAAVFGLFLIIALVAAAILGLGTVMPYWASALVFALIFLIVLAICALVGLKKVKAQLPFKPESAIFGLLFDLGVLKEGTAMSAERLKKEQAERAEQKAKEAEEAAERARQEAEERKARGEEEPKPPTFEELKQRTAERRQHLAALRDDLQSYTGDVQNNTQQALDALKAVPSEVAASAAATGRGLAENVRKPEVLQARWKSFAALGASIATVLHFLNRLVRR